jgi:hypothetical protein
MSTHIFRGQTGWPKLTTQSMSMTVMYKSQMSTVWHSTDNIKIHRFNTCAGK